MSYPKRIWLQVDPEGETPAKWPKNASSEISWCIEKINKNDVEYVLKSMLLDALGAEERANERNTDTDDQLSHAMAVLKMFKSACETANPVAREAIMYAAHQQACEIIKD